VSGCPQFILDGGQPPVDIFQEQVCAVQFPLHGKDYKWKDEPQDHKKKAENEQHYHHAAENVAEKFHRCLLEFSGRRPVTDTGRPEERLSRSPTLVPAFPLGV
jgi:hypothetical protein